MGAGRYRRQYHRRLVRQPGGGSCGALDVHRATLPPLLGNGDAYLRPRGRLSGAAAIRTARLRPLLEEVRLSAAASVRQNHDLRTYQPEERPAHQPRTRALYRYLGLWNRLALLP